jgi:hypothetical protein
MRHERATREDLKDALSVICPTLRVLTGQLLEHKPASKDAVATAYEEAHRALGVAFAACLRLQAEIVERPLSRAQSPSTSCME